MKRFFIVCIILGIFAVMPWIAITFMSKDSMYTNRELIPIREYGLVLGTSPVTQGKQNRFFTTRIEATKELYERGKIKKIIVSGAKTDDGYDEPLYMKNALIRAGIPEEDIISDDQGFSTIESVTRSQEVFNAQSVTVISQPFHIERAIFLAKMQDIEMIGFGAADIPLSQGLWTYIREIGARWKAVFDVIRM